MTFIRDIKRGDNIYRYKVETYRKDGKVKQRAEYIGKVVKHHNKETVIPRRELIEPTSISEVRGSGLLSVLYRIAEEWKISETVEAVSRTAEENEYGNAVLLLALNHITGRCALDRVAEWYRRSVLYPHLGESDLFTKKRLLAAMDSLTDDDEYGNILDYTMQFSQKMYELSSRLTKEGNSGMIYDITEVTSYSENNIYASLGYSPNNENSKLTKVCLITNKTTKLPVMLFLNNGNLPDKSTVNEMLNRLRLVKIYKKRSYMIFDRGIVSEENIRLHKNANIEIIAGLTLRRKDAVDLLSSIEEEEFVHHYNAVKHAGGFAYIVERPFTFGGIDGKAVVCLVPRLQENVRTARVSDMKDAIQKLEVRNQKHWNKTPKNDIQKIAESIIVPVKQFVKLDVNKENKNVSYTTNEALLDAEALRDGRFALFSTDCNLRKEEIFGAYFSRDTVEKAFRVYKGELELPPLRHWKTKRLMSYLQVCFISYLLQSYLMYKARNAGMEDGWTEIRFTLNEIQQVVVNTLNGEKTCYTNITPKHKSILEKLGYNLL